MFRQMKIGDEIWAESEVRAVRLFTANHELALPPHSHVVYHFCLVYQSYPRIVQQNIIVSIINKMSERGHFRGGGRGGGRGGRGQDRGGRGGHAQSGQQQEKPKKENILDLTKYMHKQVQVKFNGGREGTRVEDL